MRARSFHDRIANRPWVATSDLVFWALLLAIFTVPPVVTWAMGKGG